MRSIVRNYPGQSLESDMIIVMEPFKVLAHYYNELNILRAQQRDVVSKNINGTDDMAEQHEGSSGVDSLDEATTHDLDVLLKTFRPFYVKYFTPTELIYNTGVTPYQLLWLLFKPGTRVYAVTGGKVSGYIFEWGDRRMSAARAGTSREISYNAHCWNLTYNGRRIVRTSRTFSIEIFQGTREINSLPVFPAIYLDSSDGGKTKRQLEESGQKFYNIARQSPAHMQYSGVTWEDLYGKKLDIVRGSPRCKIYLTSN